MDRIYKNIKTGKYTDEFGESVEIEEVFRNSDLFAFSGDKHPLIIAQWNRVIAAWFVLSEYELTSPNLPNGKWSESPIHDQVKRAGLDNAGEAHTFNTMTTPRTDRAATTIKDYAGYDEVVPADVCRDIERDLAELKKDKERLDWLLKNCLIKELDLEWVHDSRETIDEAIKGEL